MLGIRLEEKLAQEQNSMTLMPDESRQRQLLMEDEDEDFMDEGMTFILWIKRIQ